MHCPPEPGPAGDAQAWVRCAGCPQGSLTACHPTTGLPWCRGPLALPPGPLQPLSMQGRGHTHPALHTAPPAVRTPRSQLRRRSPYVGHSTERCIWGVCNSYRNETALRDYNCLCFPPVVLFSGGIDKSIILIILTGSFMWCLALCGLTCSEITQSPAKPTQLSNTALPALTQMSRAVNAGVITPKGGAGGAAVVCVLLCAAQHVLSKCVCDALCVVIPLQHIVPGY